MTENADKKVEMDTIKIRATVARKIRMTAAFQDRFSYEVVEDAWIAYENSPSLLAGAQESPQARHAKGRAAGLAAVNAYKARVAEAKKKGTTLGTIEPGLTPDIDAQIDSLSEIIEIATAARNALTGLADGADQKHSPSRKTGTRSPRRVDPAT